MEIREAINSDKASIRAVHQDAFGPKEGSQLSQLAVDLMEDPTSDPTLSLVAEKGGRIVGNVIFTSAHVEGVHESHAFIMAPLAVLASEQAGGIGTQLIEKGLSTLRQRGARIVLVYGDPNYYKRTGFKAGHNLKAPHKLSYPIEAWMAQELVEGALDRAQGTIQCCKALDLPEYW